MKTIKIPTKEIRWLTDQAFSTRKREVRVVIGERVSFHNTFWDGGSKNTYRAVQLESGATANLITGSSPWTAIAEGTSITLEPGIAIVEESVFCGKTMALRLYLHPANITPALEAHLVTEEF
jgi:hypothetical protein